MQEVASSRRRLSQVSTRPRMHLAVGDVEDGEETQPEAEVEADGEAEVEAEADAGVR